MSYVDESRTSNTPMTRHQITEIFDFKSPLQATGEESSKGSNERCECRHGENMELHRFNKQGLSENGLHPKRKLVFLLEEDRVGHTFETSKCIRAKVLKSRAVQLVTRSLLCLRGGYCRECE